LFNVFLLRLNNKDIAVCPDGLDFGDDDIFAAMLDDAGHADKENAAGTQMVGFVSGVIDQHMVDY
jgi:hypothetical protein